MSVFVSILGLGFLILIHEAGHFFVARVVGMNPRKFYLGFPPAIAKTKRKGIEYGIGAIPLGGYVKIPGMHRPAAGDLVIYFGRAVEEAASLARPVEELRRSARGERLRGRARGGRAPERGGRGGAALAGRAAVRGARPLRGRRRPRPRRVLACEDLEARRGHLRRAGCESRAHGRPVRGALHGRRRQGDPGRRRGRCGDARGGDGPAAGRPGDRDRRQAGRARHDLGDDRELRRTPAHRRRAAGRPDGDAGTGGARRSRTARTGSASSSAARASGRSMRRGRRFA